jgi:hypothetical protein
MSAHPLAAITDMLRGQEAVRRATATVEWETDPRTPGRTAYRITGATRDVVQGAIDARMTAAENGDGRANFIGPHRDENGWVALGEVVLPVEVAA